jgi:hypothetical protein
MPDTYHTAGIRRGPPPQLLRDPGQPPAERLTLIAVLTLPITAVSSVYGMNIIVNDRTDFPHLAVVLAAMLVISAIVLRWAKRQEWW